MKSIMAKEHRILDAYEYRGGIPFVTKWCKMDPNKAEYLPGYLPICQCYDGPSLVHIYS